LARFSIAARIRAGRLNARRKTRRSEVAKVTSVTMVQPGLIEVAWVSTTEPLPSPSIIVITIVFGSGRWKVHPVPRTTQLGAIAPGQSKYHSQGNHQYDQFFHLCLLLSKSFQNL